MDMLIARAFNLYQQMLSPMLHAEWDDIVQKHCYTADWLDKNSVATERHAMYMSVTLRWPPRIYLELWYKRIKEMNSLAEMLPCLKDQPDCPAEIKQANVPLNNVALCDLIMRSISTAMENEYNCISDLIPTNPDEL
eukprot:992912-Ditylum_brightwellii.AAC.1